MEITDFLKALVEHNKTKNGYQVYLNSDSLDEKSAKNTGVEIGDLYFTEYVYMYPENDSMDGNRNVITVGFMS